MADVTTVSERGQVAIPARLRREHDIHARIELVWEAVGPDEWRVRIKRAPVVDPQPKLMRGFAKRFRAVKTTAEWMRELREGED